MAIQNVSSSLGILANHPQIKINPNTGERTAIFHLALARGKRKLEDGKQYIKFDTPTFITKNERIINELEKAKQYDLIFVKGTLNTKMITKSSFCENEECADEFGNRYQNYRDGSLMFVLPIALQIVSTGNTKESAVNALLEKREISNETYIMGTLCREPKMIQTKRGLTVTQFQLAIDRSFRNRDDSPEIRTDYPWVKVYGELAIECKQRLSVGSIVYINGLLQERITRRKTICENCGEEYIWHDKAMEIVPYNIEFIPGTYKTDEQIEMEKNERIEAAKIAAFGHPDDIGYDKLDADSDQDF